MDKKKQMKFNTNNFLLATTAILDAKEMHSHNISENHSLRVAYIALQIAQKLQFEPKEMFDLCGYALFHHYIDEEKQLLLGIENKENKLSNLIDFIHTLEKKYDFSKKDIENRELILNASTEIIKNEAYKNIFCEITDTIDFWLDCQTKEMMLQYIYTSLYDFTIVLDFEKILEITSMFGGLYEAVDPFLEKCKKMTEYYQFEEKDKYTFLIAGSLLHFGKLAIDEKITQKIAPLTKAEYEEIKSNVYYTKNALRAIYGFDDIAKWASRHQEKLNAKGYPSKLNGSQLSLKDRLIAILNIYHSLVSDKSYRQKLLHNKAVEIILNKVNKYELDKAIANDIDFVFGKK